MSKPNRKEKNPSGGWWSNLSKRNQGCQKIVFWWLILLLPSQLGKHFWFDFSQVLGLRIDYLAPTLYLTDVLVIFLLLLWFWEKRLSVGAYCNTPLRVAVIFLFINCLFARPALNSGFGWNNCRYSFVYFFLNSTDGAAYLG